MAKKKVIVAEETEETVDTAPALSPHQIRYVQGDEVIVLTFPTVERRDHELGRLRGTGIVAEAHNADDAEEVETDPE